MRFARLATEVFHNEDYQFEIGKAEVIRAGSDVSIIACGLMVPEAMAAAEQLAAMEAADAASAAETPEADDKSEE